MPRSSSTAPLPASEREHEPDGQTIALISDLIRGLRHELGNLTTVLSLDMSLLEQAIKGPEIDQARLNELKYNLRIWNVCFHA